MTYPESHDTAMTTGEGQIDARLIMPVNPENVGIVLGALHGSDKPVPVDNLNSGRCLELIQGLDRLFFSTTYEDTGLTTLEARVEVVVQLLDMCPDVHPVAYGIAARFIGDVDSFTSNAGLQEYASTSRFPAVAHAYCDLHALALAADDQLRHLAPMRTRESRIPRLVFLAARIDRNSADADVARAGRIADKIISASSKRTRSS